MFNNEDEFLEFLFENYNKSTLKLLLSAKLIIKLRKIKHEISKELLKLDDNKNYEFKISYVSNTEKPDTLSFMTVNKIIYDQYDDPDTNPFYNKKRSEISIGRFITKIFEKKFPASKLKNAPILDLPNDIESFIMMYKATYDNNTNFELVKGEDIRYFYSLENYAAEAKETSNKLGGSCMRYDKCQPFFDIYVKNIDKVQMLILHDNIETTNDGRFKIKGRAIVWKLDKLNYENTDRYFMDRIYTVNEDDSYKFINYAKEQGWLYKERQYFGREYKIVDPINNTTEWVLMEVNTKSYSYDHYPYMDTLSLFISGTLSNEIQSDVGYELNSTDGSYDDLERNTVFSRYHEEEIEEDEATWCEFSNDWCRRDDAVYLDNRGEYCTPDTNTFDFNGRTYLIDDGVYDEINSEYILEDDAVHSEYDDCWMNNEEAIYIEYMSDYVLPKHSEYSDYENRELLKDDAVYSNILKSFIHKDNEVEFFTTLNSDGEGNEIDITHEDEKESTIFEFDGKWYSEDIIEEVRNNHNDVAETEKDVIVENKINIYNFSEFLKNKKG